MVNPVRLSLEIEGTQVLYVASNSLPNIDSFQETDVQDFVCRKCQQCDAWQKIFSQELASIL
jgi:hypothetical protein